jgi:hypothetical protein
MTMRGMGTRAQAEGIEMVMGAVITGHLTGTGTELGTGPPVLMVGDVKGAALIMAVDRVRETTMVVSRAQNEVGLEAQ